MARVGAVLDERFEVVRELGERKLLVRDAQGPPEPCILHVIDPREDPYDGEVRREVESTLAVEHPGIARIHAVGTLSDGQVFYTQEYVEGQGLYQWALTRAPEDVLPVFAQLLQVMGAYHAAGLVIGGRRPIQVKIEERPDEPARLRLVDQGGLIREFTRAGERGVGIHGLAPERRVGARIDRRANIYEAGLILYELLAGSDAAIPTFQKVQSDTPPPITQVVPGLPLDLATFVMVLLRRSPDDRPPSVGQALVSLESLCGQQLASGDYPSPRLPLPPPLVGRGAELERLEAWVGHLKLPETTRWTRHGSGRPAKETPTLVAVSGEPGSGRRRLIDELALRLDAEEVALVRGTCGLGGQGPFGPFEEILRNLVARPAVRRALGTHVPAHARWALRGLLPDLAAELPAGITPPPLADSASAQERRIDALAEHLLAAARVSPLAIVLNDLQRARGPARELAMHVARRAWVAGRSDLLREQQEQPQLIVLATWNGPSEELSALPFARVLDLDPLTSQDLEFLGTAVLGDEGCDADLRHALESHAQGNPALALRLVRAHLAGTLQPEPPGAEQVHLLDQLGEAMLGLEEAPLRATLVLGLLARPTSLELLAEVTGSKPEDLLPALERMSEEGLLERTLGPHYTHAHRGLGQRLARRRPQEAGELLSLLPNVLGRGVDPEAWGTPPGQVLEVAELAALGIQSEPLLRCGPLAISYLESLGAYDRASNLCSALARVDPERREELALREIEDRIEGGDPRRAEELVRARIDGNEELEPASEPARIAGLYRQLIRCLLAQEKESEARSALGWIMEFLADEGGHGLERARFAELATSLHLAADEREDGAARNGEGMEVLRESGATGPEAVRLRAKLLAHDGNLAYIAESYAQAQQLLKASLAIQEREGLQEDAARTLHQLGRAAFAADRLGQAESHWRSALARFEDLRELRGAATVRSSLGLLAARQGALGRAREHLQESLRLREQLGDRRGTAASLHNLGYVYASAGAMQEAAAAYRECLDLRLDDEDRYYAASAADNLGEVLLWLGQTDEAEELFLNALSARVELGDRRGEAATLSHLAEIDLGRGAFSRMLEREARSMRICQEVGDPEDLAHALWRRARCFLALGRLELAKDTAKEAFRRVQDEELSLQEGACRLTLGEILARTGRLAGARRELERARRAAEQVGDRLTARSAVIELAALHLANDRPKDARALLDSRAIPRPGRPKPLQGSQPVDRQGILRVRERLLRGRIQLSLEGGSVSSAARCGEEALAEARRGAFRDLEWRALQVLAAAREIRGEHEKALSLTVEAQELIEQLEAEVPDAYKEAYLAADPLRAAGLRGDSPVKVLGVRAQGGSSEAQPLASVGGGDLLTAMVESTVPTIQPAPSRSASRAPSLAAAPAAPVDGRVQTLLKLNRLIVDEPDVGKAQDAIVKAAVELCGAERGFLALFGETHEDVMVLSAWNMDDVEGPRQRFFRHCAFKAANTGQLVLSAEARVLAETKQHAHVVGLGLRSVLAAPVVAPDERRGALYVDHTFRIGCFTDKEVELLEALADQCAMAIGRGALEAALHHRQGVSPGQEQRQFLAAKGTLEKPGPVHLGDPARGLAGRSKAMREAIATLQKVAGSDSSVLITGPPGVGKGVAARAVHDASQRRSLIVCDLRELPVSGIERELFGYTEGAFPGADVGRKGLLRQAHGGTLLLEHFDEAPLEVQAKLIKAIETKSVRPLGADDPVAFDARIVATGAEGIEDRVRAGTLREDLFLLCAEVRVALPPLDERPEDKEPLLDAIISSWKRAGRPPTLTSEARAALVARRYPGNARELNATLVAAASLAGDDPIAPSDLPPVRSNDPPPLAEALKAFERRTITAALLRNKGDLTASAKTLGITRRALKRKLEQHDIAP